MRTSQSITDPSTVRVRINHDRTSKGWRCNETTVEVTYPLALGTDREASMSELIEVLLHEAAEAGRGEAIRRNVAEGIA